MSPSGSPIFVASEGHQHLLGSHMYPQFCIIFLVAQASSVLLSVVFGVVWIQGDGMVPQWQLWASPMWQSSTDRRVLRLGCGLPAVPPV